MEIIIKSIWTQEIREEKINEYVYSLGEKIFQKCKISNNITNEEFESISLDLCVNYAKNKVLPYIFNMSSGSFSILITEKAVLDVLNLAKLENSKLTV